MADASARPGTAGVLERFEGEVGRRLVHASGGLLPLAYVLLSRVEGLGVEWWWLQAALLVGVAVAAVLEFVRLRSGLDWWVFEHLTREYERHKVAGYALYVLSFAVVALLFREPVALAAMFTLAVADPVGGVLGGEDPIPVKRPAALAGTFLVCLAIGAVVLVPTQSASAGLAAAAAGAAAATVADGVFWEVRDYVLDDNLLIPIATAAAAELVLSVVG